MIDGPQNVDRHTLPAHDLDRDVGQPLGVGELR